VFVLLPHEFGELRRRQRCRIDIAEGSLVLQLARGGDEPAHRGAVLSIAVRKGQPKPDISSLAAAKEALLAAKTIAYYSAETGGADGVLSARDFARLGIAHEVAAKAKIWKSVQETAASRAYRAGAARSGCSVSKGNPRPTHRTVHPASGSR
jgi:hypothetical protein